MGTDIVKTDVDDAINAALMQGDLSRLSPKEKQDYYLATCKSLGLNPLTKPFEYLRLNGREVLYATKACSEQLRARDQISLSIVDTRTEDGVYVVRARAVTPGGRTDESSGAVAVERLAGEARANALMKAETKAKRRVTLSICGLGMLDESEVSDIPGSQAPTHDAETGELPHDTMPAPVEGVRFSDAFRNASKDQAELVLYADLEQKLVDAREARDIKDYRMVVQMIAGYAKRAALSLDHVAQLREFARATKAAIESPPPMTADELRDEPSLDVGSDPAGLS